ncbi:MAG: outer membrane protein transport protein [candidate division WOR-3 bacterium]
MRKIIIVIGMVSILFAGGWDHPVQGIRGLGMGDAYTALSEDASAIWWNPGGLSFQKNMLEIELGGTYDMPMHVYKFPDPSNPSQEKEAKSSLNTFVPQGFLSYKLNKFGLGFGYYVEYGGGGVDWKKEDIGMDVYSVLGVMAFAPTFSYMINEKIGIGAKVEVLYGSFDSEMKNGEEIKHEGSGWAFTGGAGLLWKPTDILSVGLNLRGPFTLKMDGEAEHKITFPVETTLTHDTKVKADFPITVGLGLGIKPIPNLLGALDFEYTTWSTLDYVEMTIKGPTGDTTMRDSLLFEDAFKIKIGCEYTLPMGLSLRTGFAYDKAASPDSTLSPANIDVDKFVIFGGLGYSIGNFGIDLAILKAFGSERKYEEEVAPGITVTQKFNMNPMAIGIALKYRL